MSNILSGATRQHWKHVIAQLLQLDSHSWWARDVEPNRAEFFSERLGHSVVVDYGNIYFARTQTATLNRWGYVDEISYGRLTFCSAYATDPVVLAQKVYEFSLDFDAKAFSETKLQRERQHRAYHTASEFLAGVAFKNELAYEPTIGVLDVGRVTFCATERGLVFSCDDGVCVSPELAQALITTFTEEAL